MRRFLFSAVTFIALCISNALVAQVKVFPTAYDFGTVEIASSMNAAYTYTNYGSRKNFLLKVEAPSGVTYKKSNKPVEPGDTDTLFVYYAPEKNGVFNEAIKLYFSDDPKPQTVRLKGNLKILDRVADIDCPTFDGKSTAGTNVVLCNVNYTVIDSKTKQPIPGAEITNFQNGVKRFTVRTQPSGSIPISISSSLYAYEVTADNYNVLHAQHYIQRGLNQITFELTPLEKEQPKPDTLQGVATTKVDTIPIARDTTMELPVNEYAYNNIVFLIDVSSSMNTGDRMPLLKTSMTELAKRLRQGDRVAIVTYADKAKIVRPSMPVVDKSELENIILNLTPNGGTSADKGLAMAQNVLLENYLPDGNNQLVLATDGSFALKEKDLQLFQNGAVNGQPVNICVVGFGNNKNSLQSLKKTAKRFKARYLHIDKSENANDALLDEVKKNSKR